MTNNEAIRTLKANYPDACFEQLREAVDVAINALTALPEKTQLSEEDATSDCISRKAAIDAILAVTGNSSVRELYEHVQEHGLSEMWSGGVNAAIDIIIAVPPAQSERKSGKWVRYDGDWLKTMCKCSECGAMIDIDEKYRNFFCYHCGSDMREDVLPSAQPTQCNSSNVLRHPQCANRTKLGNCDPVGGFCTSVPKEICDAQEHDTLNGSDLISRAAAIDAVHKNYDVILDFTSDGQTISSSIEDILSDLPSAQADLPIKEKCAFCPHCNNCDVNDDLSIQPCVDTISRQAVIENICTMLRNCFDASDEMIESVKITVGELPSAQPDLEEVYAHAETEAEARYHAQQRWIPCSERLPKKNGFYLCTTKDCITILEFIAGNPHYHEEPSFVSDVLGKCNSYVVAWMPLPECYREGRE